MRVRSNLLYRLKPMWILDLFDVGDRLICRMMIGSEEVEVVVVAGRRGSWCACVFGFINEVYYVGFQKKNKVVGRMRMMMMMLMMMIVFIIRIKSFLFGKILIRRC
ncbi:hypothetical protein Hanom_Chr16g01451011 [Helianthus anomalus]